MDNKKHIINTFLKLKSASKKVTYNDLQNFDQSLTRDKIRHHFGSITNLENIAREKFPKRFHDIYVDSLLSNEKIEEFNDNVLNKKRFIITTAGVGCKVDKNFLKSIDFYCKKNDAQLLILLAADPASVGDWTVDKALADYHIVPRDTALNSNLFLSTIKLTTKQINPTTGLNRIGQRSGSFIYASPKQFLKYVPVSNTKMPHAIMTTGAVTLPDYAPKTKEHRYMSERTAYIANHDHVIGGIVVEIEDDNIFHFRQIQADRSGSFIDMGVQYSSNSSKKVRPIAFTMGDWHSGQTDPVVKKCWEHLCLNLRPKYLIMHDVFDALSINHHEEKMNILKAIRAEKKQLNLKDELTGLANDLNELSFWSEKIVIVKSNHDEFLEKYLQLGLYVKDPQNHLLGLELSIQLFSHNDPLKYIVNKLGLKNKNKVIWLKRDEDFKLAGIQYGAHGDKGGNGSKGTLMGMEMAYGASTTGHTHSAGIIRDAWGVGTSTYLKIGYNVGPSSWTQTAQLSYSNGSRQLINVINGKYRLLSK